MDEKTTYNLTEFNVQDIGFILEAISKVPAPMIVSRPVYDKIVAQVQDQDKQTEAKAKAKAAAAAKLVDAAKSADSSGVPPATPPAATDTPAT